MLNWVLIPLILATNPSGGFRLLNLDWLAIRWEPGHLVKCGNLRCSLKGFNFAVSYRKCWKLQKLWANRVSLRAFQPSNFKSLKVSHGKLTEIFILNFSFWSISVHTTCSFPSYLWQSPQLKKAFFVSAENDDEQNFWISFMPSKHFSRQEQI